MANSRIVAAVIIAVIIVLVVLHGRRHAAPARQAVVQPAAAPAAAPAQPMADVASWTDVWVRTPTESAKQWVHRIYHHIVGPELAGSVTADDAGVRRFFSKLGMRTKLDEEHAKLIIQDAVARFLSAQPGDTPEMSAARARARARASSLLA